MRVMFMRQRRMKVQRHGRKISSWREHYEQFRNIVDLPMSLWPDPYYPRELRTKTVEFEVPKPRQKSVRWRHTKIALMLLSAHIAIQEGRLEPVCV